MAEEDITLANNPAASRYELHVGQDLAGVIDYREEDGRLDLFHTGVEPEFGGRGLGQRIVEFALTDILDSGGRVIPTCPFISRYIDAHPDFGDLVN